MRSIPMPSSSSNRAPLFETMTGSTTTNGRSSSSNRGRDGFDDGRRGQHAGLGRMDGDIGGDRFDLRSDEIGRQRQDSVTPTVFCAVTAVIALVPYTPSAANVFRSA